MLDEETMRFKLPFDIKTSHRIEQFEFQGSNAIDFQIDGSEFLVQYKNEDKLVKLNLETKYLEVECEESNLEDLVSRIESILSFKIDEDNKNRHYGCYFLEIDRFKISIINNGNPIGLRDSLSITSTKSKKISFNNYFEYDEFILSTYYEALKAPSSRLKFFNLALILEYIESSSVYKKMFLTEDNFLFTKGAFDELKSDFSQEQISRLKSLINSPTYTKQSRKNKLYELLKKYDLLNIKYIGNKKLTIDDIGHILQLRNKIFHSSSVEFENVLWYQLFPLIENIISQGKKFD